MQKTDAYFRCSFFTNRIRGFSLHGVHGRNKFNTFQSTRLRVNTRIGLLGILLCVSAAFSQEVYGTYGHYRSITVNTSSTGANVAATQYKFPVLIRLNSSNFNFALAKGDGRDVRFSKTNTLPLKYQIENWDSAGQSASIWVLLDTVLGNSNVAKFRMYYGKAGVADSSKGSAVFDTGNGFQGVFHLAEATNDTIRDATVNRFKGIPRNRGGSNPVNVTGISGNAKNFLGDTTLANNSGGAYRLATSTGGNTFTNNALNFQNDSATRNGTSQYTISSWINVTQYPRSLTARKGIIAKSGGTNGSQYQLRLLDPAINNIYTPYNDTMRIGFSDGPSAIYVRGDHRLTPWLFGYPASVIPAAWQYITARRSGVVGTPANLKVFVDGVFACSSSTSMTMTTRSDFDVTIGSFSNDSGFFSGKLDEVRFENVARDTNWIKLSYETQKPGSTVVAISGDSLPPCLCEFGYRTNPLVLKTNVTMIPDSVIASIGTITSYSVSPTLPAGLSLNTTNGVISGTPAVAQAVANYTITGLGPGGSNVFVIAIAINAPPVITVNPANVIVYTVQNAGKFWVGASSTAPLTYKWIRTRSTVIDTLTNTGIFTGATTDTLRFINARIADSGSLFKCLVSNVAGSAVSTSGSLTVRIVDPLVGRYVVHVQGLGPYSFRIPDGISSVQLSAEDMMGRVVWNKDFTATKNRIVSWNGNGMDGRPVSKGMYIIRLHTIESIKNHPGP